MLVEACNTIESTTDKLADSRVSLQGSAFSPYAAIAKKNSKPAILHVRNTIGREKPTPIPTEHRINIGWTAATKDKLASAK